MAAKRKALGAGLGGGMNALIPPAKSKETAKSTKVEKAVTTKKVPGTKAVKIENKEAEKVDIISGETMVKISKVEPNREQPRKQFDEDALIELADSIKQFGILQPLLVQDKDNYYEIIAGERRWRAAKLAGLKEVPVIIKDLTNQEVVEISLIENIQRENLNPVEEAIAYKRLMEDFSLKQDEIADRVAKSRTAITNSMRLLKLSEKVQQMLIDEMISSGHARTLLGIEDHKLQETLAMKIFDEKLSVRETEKLVKSITDPSTKKKRTVAPMPDAAIYEKLEERLKSIVGTKVSINRRTDKKGKIEIEYYSHEELERILDLFETIHV